MSQNEVYMFSKLIISAVEDEIDWNTPGYDFCFRAIYEDTSRYADEDLISEFFKTEYKRIMQHFSIRKALANYVFIAYQQFEKRFYSKLKKEQSVPLQNITEPAEPRRCMFDKEAFQQEVDKIHPRSNSLYKAIVELFCGKEFIFPVNKGQPFSLPENEFKEAIWKACQNVNGQCIKKEECNKRGYCIFQKRTSVDAWRKTCKLIDFEKVVSL